MQKIKIEELVTLMVKELTNSGYKRRLSMLTTKHGIIF